VNLECYKNDDAFIIYAECAVFYDGRASSTLERGNYLIIKKPDGSLMVHGANHVPALNYISSGATIAINENTIIATRKSETIKIICYNWHDALQLVNWSINKIKIRMTEAELTNQIASSPAKYFGPGTYSVEKEYQTSAGPVDLLVQDHPCREIDSAVLYNEVSKMYIVETKRRTITLKDCYQVQRYYDAIIGERTMQAELRKTMKLNQPDVIACLAGPGISANALSHCEKHGFKYLQVLWEESVP